MPVVNVIDTRTNEFNPNCDAVLEIWTRFVRHETHGSGTGHIGTEWIEKAEVRVILGIAMNYGDNVTVYLYDAGKVRAEINSMPLIHPRIKEEPYREKSKLLEIVT